MSRCLAIMYHYVRDRAGTAEREIRGLSTAAFTDQLDRLCEVLTPIDWPTYVAWRAGRTAVPGDAFFLTFDDCLADHAEVVFPILESRGLRGVFFVQTDVLTGTGMSTAHQIHLLMCALTTAQWWEAVQRWLDENATDTRNRHFVDTEAALRVYAYETPERARVKFLLTQILPLDVRERMIDDLFAEHIGVSGDYASRWYMNWDQLIAMQGAGHTIGGHGHRHVPYERLTGHEQVHDLARCASILRDGLGVCERPFSYPYGSFDDRIAQRCAVTGFVNGFTTQSGWIGAAQNAHRLSRVDTIHVDAFIEREFACKQV